MKFEREEDKPARVLKATTTPNDIYFSLILYSSTLALDQVLVVPSTIVAKFRLTFPDSPQTDETQDRWTIRYTK